MTRSAKINETALQRHQKSIYNLLFRGTKFNLVGWLGMVVNSGCLYFFKGILGVPLIPASLLSIEIAIIHNFIWHRYWTWKDRKSDHPLPFLKQLIVYNLMTGLVDLVVNVTILWVLTTFFGVYYLIANIAGMIMGPFIKFWLNEKIIFKES